MTRKEALRAREAELTGSIKTATAELTEVQKALLAEHQLDRQRQAVLAAAA